jgi:putative FmdB family regulatory protein
MPVYEFLCKACQRESSLFVKSMTASITPLCPACGSREVQRLISGFAYHKSLKTIHEGAGEPDKAGPDYYQDPRNIGRWTEKRFNEMGMEMPSQVEEMIQAAREGEMPSPVKDL